MATFPALGGSIKAMPRKEADIEFTNTAGDEMRGQSFAYQILYDITINYEVLTTAEAVTLQNFFDANRNTVVTTRIFDEQESYTGILLKQPIVEVLEGGFVKATQRLIGTRV